MRKVIRSEIKHISLNNNYNIMRKFVNKINAFKIFPTRKISSIYFDNKNYKSFLDSEEGLTPRKKIRIRTYDDFNSIEEIKINKLKFNYECKIAEDKYDKKISNVLEDPYDKIKNGVYDNDLGYCEPTIKVSYTRDYFLFKSSIITLDYNIKFSKNLLGRFINFDSNYMVVEFKNKSRSLNKMLFESTGLKSIRYSKYTSATNQSINFT